jgi:hypothetical protein
MANRRTLVAAAAALSVAAGLVACESGARSPLAPSAAVGLGGELNPDGSTLKVSAPLALSPTDGTLSVSTTVSLVARLGTGLYAKSDLGHRFQVSDSDSFGTILANGSGSIDSQGLVRFTVDPPLATGKKVFWHVRAELQDGFGPWSATMSFTTTGATAAPPSTSTPSPAPGNLPRTADPPAGQRLPLPNRQDVLSRFTNFGDPRSCPRGIKYVNNPWQDEVIDAFRQTDSRWGYNGKPNRTASDNGGVPVVAAGDEAAYHYSGGADQNSTDVHLVDMLIGHCGGNPSLTWRVFTGEEPGFWTGAGRF